MNAQLQHVLQPLRGQLAHIPSLHRLYSHCPEWLRVPDELKADDMDRIRPTDPVLVDWPTGIKRPFLGLIQDNHVNPSWTKYQKFCRANGLSFEFLRIHEHDWLEQARRYDIIVGHPISTPSRLEEIWRKTYILERYLGIMCYPSTADLALYEDKHMQHVILGELGMPVVPTWVSYDQADALRLAAKLDYPVVSKLITAAGSRGVEMVKNRRAAERVIRKTFSARGRYWHWPYLRQKDYVLFQKFIHTDGYDVRVECMGDMMFGYYRKARQGDFRASGSGIVQKRSLPESMLRIAHATAQALQTPYLSVDFITSTAGEEFITEISHFNTIESPEQLRIDGVPGTYIMEPTGTIRFQTYRVWVQELALKRVCEQYIRAQQAGPTPAAAPSFNYA